MTSFSIDKFQYIWGEFEEKLQESRCAGRDRRSRVNPNDLLMKLTSLLHGGTWKFFAHLHYRRFSAIFASYKVSWQGLNIVLRKEQTA